MTMPIWIRFYCWKKRVNLCYLLFVLFLLKIESMLFEEKQIYTIEPLEIIVCSVDILVILVLHNDSIKFLWLEYWYYSDKIIDLIDEDQWLRSSAKEFRDCWGPNLNYLVILVLLTSIPLDSLLQYVLVYFGILFQR